MTLVPVAELPVEQSEVENDVSASFQRMSTGLRSLRDATAAYHQAFLTYMSVDELNRSIQIVAESYARATDLDRRAVQLDRSLGDGSRVMGSAFINGRQRALFTATSLANKLANGVIMADSGMVEGLSPSENHSTFYVQAGMEVQIRFAPSPTNRRLVTNVNVRAGTTY